MKKIKELVFSLLTIFEKPTPTVVKGKEKDDSYTHKNN